MVFHENSKKHKHLLFYLKNLNSIWVRLAASHYIQKVMKSRAEFVFSVPFEFWKKGKLMVSLRGLWHACVLPFQTKRCEVDDFFIT